MASATEAAELGIAKVRAARSYAMMLSAAFRTKLQAEAPDLLVAFDHLIAAEDAWHEAFTSGMQGVHDSGPPSNSVVPPSGAR